jgi:hypothetical protein
MILLIWGGNVDRDNVGNQMNSFDSAIISQLFCYLEYGRMEKKK